MTAIPNRAPARELAQSSRCVLRRRQPKVVVRAPEAPPCSFPKVGQERRARVSTLVGIGAREAMPTLFDFDEPDDEPTRPRGVALDIQSESDAFIHVALAEWGDDEDDTCFDV